ncbi:hypothetical protein, partial [Yoonia sediminilitoris]|uniref:hypothetical protein n=1 Tax=Yoonia sediminilitoris TaxID=1286148 RepID=UPI001B3B3DF9
FVSSQNARRQEQCETSATSAIAARAASSMSPQETNRIFAACARGTVYAAIAKNSVSQRGV